MVVVVVGGTVVAVVDVGGTVVVVVGGVVVVGVVVVGGGVVVVVVVGAAVVDGWVDAVVLDGSAGDDGGSPAGGSAPSPVDDVHAAVTSRSPPITATARRSRTGSSVGAKARPALSPSARHLARAGRDRVDLGALRTGIRDGPRPET